MGRTPARAAKRRRVVRPPVYASEGFCPVCQTAARFSARHAWHRDHLLCDNCGSIPRERALALVLEERFPNWRKLRIHESSPEPRGTSRKLAQECSGYVASQYFADLAPGAMRNGFRNENLERQSFADRAFDLVVTLDVMEHVNDPEACFKEIWRTLRPGGAYIFTTPTYKGSPESERVARFMPDGGVEHYREPEYHGNPVDPRGSLVTFRYGYDLPELIRTWAPFDTRVCRFHDHRHGVIGEFTEVYLCARSSP
jgi:SAM-dependent methyltransferase